ncbi:MAG: heme o synthase [Phycisphaerales bacterium]|nr:heme o synthase [Phycisphaerales bacterium]
MSDILELSQSSPSIAESSRVAAFLELCKPRIASMVLVAAAVGFCFGRPFGGTAAVLDLLSALLGIGLVAAGANALNQYLEADFDRRMPRTERRPLPSGRLTPTEVLVFGVSSGVAGMLCLAIQNNPLAALLSAITLTTYVFVYTPMKRATPLCVYIGAIPGALPPVIGWAAGAGSLSPQAWLLFAIVYFWQLPHFAAIAWQYRDDYEKGGYPMLSVGDVDGMRTCRHMMTHTVTLVMASLLPTFAAMTGPSYAISAMLLGIAFLAFGGLFMYRRSAAHARAVVIASVAYLPLLFIIMMVDRVPLF